MTWREQLVAYIRQEARPVEKFSHQPRLYALARQIAAGTYADDDVLFAAIYLHDLGVFVGHRPEDPEQLARWDNTAYAMQQAPAVLQRIGFPQEKVARVVECIAHHQPHAEPESLEATILRDADILEQLGAVAVLRTVCKVGRDTRFHTFAGAIGSLNRALNTLPQQIRTDRARELAAPRIEVLRSFLKAAQQESGGEL
ncbi:MAG: HD domain-containing protein [Acidobacteria bacterium]|nr:HD domain-containing protein [Acidobacteriota bacterium]